MEECMETIDSFLGEWARAEGAGDASRLDHLLSDDFLGVGPLGFVLPTRAWLDRDSSGALTYRSFSLEDIQTQTHGGTVIVAARQTAPGDYDGHPTSEIHRDTLVVMSDPEIPHRQPSGLVDATRGAAR
jgi:Domain of unknown function (DUF4440)